MTTSKPDGLPSQYAPAEVEGRLYERWEKAGYFQPELREDPEAETFCVVLPPPNVTGNLHIGHALDHTLMDILVRRRRMQGYRTLWLPGMDHAGIATQNVVERELAKEGLSRHDLGREAFIDRVWEWKAEYGGRILNQMRRLGDSVDWSRERFTMDEGLSRAVLTIFKRLYDDGLIYRDNRIINWCPRCLTALSDIEVDHADDDGELVSIRYGSVSPGGDPRNPREGENSIVVATTRAETMLGDTAVAVHPDDERYAHLVGTTVELPLTGRRIPVVADAHVDPAFGTGAVKVTPAHDPNDFEIGRRHDLEALTIMDERGVIIAPGPFAGLDRFEARPAIVAALREEGRIVREIRPYPHAVGHCSRCGTTVEPRLSLQWFVRVAPLAKAAGDAVRDGRVRLSPPEMNARFFGWVDDMHDWCISRQLWWGHRIPVFYGPDGEVRCVGPDEAAPEGWTQDPDVLDTWFSSGLWPFSTLGWPDDTDDLRAFYPTSVLGTGYDILFFWVARMMMFGLYAMRGAPPADAVPFRVVALHGLVRDQYGKKMSKSRGNTVDPIDWMDRFGTDATRFTLARGATPGSDEAVSEDWAAGSRNFCNKLWNATRFALMNGAFSQDPTDLSVPAVDLPVTGRWILSRLSAVTAEVNGLLEDYEFGKACEALYHFAWDEFCDWYLELAKVPLAAGGAAAEATRGVLGFVLDQMLRLLHPVMPYLTDELWTALISASPRGDDSPSTPREGDRESVMVAAWPSFSYSDAAAEAELGSVQRLVTEVRRFRSDQGLKPGQKVAARLTGISGTALAAHEEAIRSLLRLTEPGDGFAASASLAAEGVTVQVDLAGTVDVAAERKRLEKDLAIARKEAAQVSAKLGNEGFMAKAPQDVVVKTRERLAVAEADISRLESRLATLG